MIHLDKSEVTSSRMLRSTFHKNTATLGAQGAKGRPVQKKQRLGIWNDT